MPRGSKVAPPAEAPSAAIIKWINDVNKVMGWEALSAPELPIERRGEDVYETPVNRFLERLEEAEDRIDEVAVKSDLAENRRELDVLTLRLAEFDEDEDSTDLENEIRELKEDIAEAEMDLRLLDKLSARVERLVSIEDTVDEEIDAVGEEILTLREAADPPADLRTVDKNKLKDFQQIHKNVAGEVKSAQQEIVTLVKKTSDGDISRNYQAISDAEYHLLFGMMEQARLILLTGDVDAAIAKLQETREKNKAFRTARTGADPIAQKETLHPDLDGKISAIASNIEALQKHGYPGVADEYQGDLLQIQRSVRGAKSVNSENIGGTWRPICEQLLETTRRALSKHDDIEKLFDEAALDIKGMRANGHETRPRRAQEKIDEFDPGPDMDENVEAAREIRNYAAEKLRQTMTEDTGAANIDKAALERQLTELKSRYEAMFKHDKSGAIKTIKDSQTGEDKGRKENRNLPRETLNEIDLRIHAAEQLLASNSVDALKDAERYVGNVEIFMRNVETNPEGYKRREKRVERFEKRVNRLADKYGLYEIGARLNLKNELEDLKENLPTRPQARMNSDLDDFHKDLSKLEERVSILSARKKSLRKKEKAIGKSLAKIAKLLKGKYSNIFVRFDGYYGKQAEALQEASDLLTKRSAVSIESAEEKLLDIEVKVLEILSLMKRDQSRKDKDKLSGAESLTLNSFVSDAGDKQMAHNANEAQKKPFESAVKTLLGDLKTLKADLKKLKADASDADALESEVETLASEMKGSGEYIDGVDRLGPMRKKFERIKEEADAALEIVDAGLDRAAQLCVDQIKTFRRYASGFVADKVTPAGVTDEGNALDDDFERAKIESYMQALLDAVPAKAVDDLNSHVGVVSDREKEISVRKLARREALRTVRNLMSVFDGFKPMSHFQVQPFESTKSIAGIRQALPRLEVKLLTAIGKT